MFIRTKYYDNGRAEAKVIPESEVREQTEGYSAHDGFDTYLEEYDSVEDFIEELEIDLDDVIPLVLSLADGESVDITNYI